MIASLWARHVLVNNNLNNADSLLVIYVTQHNAQRVNSLLSSRASNGLNHFNGSLVLTRNRMAEIAIERGTLVAPQVATTNLHAHELPIFGDPKPLGCPFMGFLLRHHASYLRSVCSKVTQFRQHSLQTTTITTASYWQT